MMKNDIRVLAGPAPSASRTAQPFWNIAQNTEDDAEITIYGEIVTHRPTNWLTGEPEDKFTSPDGFLDDLNKIQNAQNVTVQINSVGGDLYTAIGIANRLKELAGNTVAIIDGIAASAATVIAMGCNTIRAYSGSLFMVHEALTTLCGAYNHKALMEADKRLQAANAAAAEMYDAKTKLGVDKIRSIMAKESWMTGKAAKADGWIDEVIDGEDPEMSLSKDKAMMTVNGITMSVKGFSALPGNIPIQNSAQQPTVPPAPAPTADNANKPITSNEGGITTMTVEEIRQQHPDIVQQIEASAQESARTQAIQDERYSSPGYPGDRTNHRRRSDGKRRNVRRARLHRSGTCASCFTEAGTDGCSAHCEPDNRLPGFWSFWSKCHTKQRKPCSRCRWKSWRGRNERG